MLRAGVPGRQNNYMDEHKDKDDTYITMHSYGQVGGAAGWQKCLFSIY